MVEWPKEKDTEIEGNEEATFELQIEYIQATTESFDGKASHEDIVENTAGGGAVIPPEPTPVNLVETITGADYGKRINYKATVKGQEVSNWKVFLNDGTNVYIILDDYLPNTLVPESTGLTKGDQTKPYNVWSDVSRDALVSALTTQSHWSEFANGIDGATAIGSPTNAQFVASWNANPEVNGRQLIEGEYYDSSTEEAHKVLSDPTKLYVPYTEQVASSCNGYFLASSCTVNATNVWTVNYAGNMNYIYYRFYSENLGVRPVVCLPSTTEGTVGEIVVIDEIK